MILRTLFLHCILFQNIIQSSAKTDTFDMKWIANSGYNPPLNSTISCNEAYYIKIINIYGTIPIWGRVSVADSNIRLINDNCYHKRLCPVPVLPQWQLLLRWKLHIEYDCKATQVTTTYSSILPITVVPTTKEVHATTNVSQPIQVTTTSSATLPITTVPTTKEMHVTTKVSQPIQVTTTPSSTLPITAGPTTKGEHVTTKVSEQKDSKSAVTTTVAVAVSMATLTVAGGVVVFIVLYRRCQRSGDVKGIYNNDPNIAKLKEVDISYTTESESLGVKIRHALPYDIQSNLVDSGMPIEDFRNIDNDDHKTVIHTTDASVQNADDQYYTIKENANAEYNKITFKLKEIPEDPNYGHTVSSDDTMDKTYDHAQASAIPTYKVGFCDYSHINQNKAKEDANITRIICPKNANYSTTTPGDDGVENDSITDHNYWLLEKKDTDSTADNIDDERHCHSYFILSKKESQGSGELQNNELAILAGDAGRDSHNYFVLDKTNLTELKMGPNQTDEVDRSHRIKYSSNESGEHTYFENPLPSNEHADNHQYQAIRERTPMSEIAVPADISHNYFVLEKDKV